MPAVPKRKSSKPPTSSPPNAFIGRAAKPRESDVASALGSAKPLWNEVVRELESEFGLKPEWNSFSVKYGWSLRMKKADRNVVYLGPYSGGFAAQLILGAKALAAAKKELPAAVFAEAKKFPEGTAIRIEMQSADQIEVVRVLVIAKLGA